MEAHGIVKEAAIRAHTMNTYGCIPNNITHSSYKYIIKTDDELYNNDIMKVVYRKYFTNRKIFERLNMTVNDLMNMTNSEYDVLMSMIPEFSQILQKEFSSSGGDDLIKKLEGDLD
jgi:predicted YcjX-like family ATPase